MVRGWGRPIFCIPPSTLIPLAQAKIVATWSLFRVSDFSTLSAETQVSSISALAYFKSPQLCTTRSPLPLKIKVQNNSHENFN